MDDMIVDDNLTEGSPDIEYEIIKQSHTNEGYREIMSEGVTEILGGLRREDGEMSSCSKG